MPDREPTADQLRAVAELYHALFTGIVLSTVARAGTDRAARLTYEVFNRQRAEKFVPGLRKLGIDGLPDAVAAAQYHYLSNHIGGVKVQYMPESDRKAWIRYETPRWAWAGTALCGIPTEVSEAMLRGWHARNGVALGNPRLGFVCTKQATDGDAGLEGYYLEHDEPLEPSERLRFARDEDAPDFDPALAPTLPTDTWPAERLSKAHRSYAMTYPQTAFAAAIDLWGEEQATALLGLCGKQIGMQLYDDVVAMLGIVPDRSAAQFTDLLGQLLTGHGDSWEPDGAVMRQTTWRFGAGVRHPQVVARIWPRLVEGLLASHNHRLRLDVRVAGNGFDWQVR